MTTASCVELSIKISFVLKMDVVHLVGMVVCSQRETCLIKEGPKRRILEEKTAEVVRTKVEKMTE